MCFNFLTCINIEQLPLGSAVYSIDASNGDVLYIGGLFSDVGAKNIIAYDINQGRFVPLDNFGLNGQVNKVLLNENSKSKTYYSTSIF